MQISLVSLVKRESKILRSVFRQIMERDVHFTEIRNPYRKSLLIAPVRQEIENEKIQNFLSFHFLLHFQPAVNFLLRCNFVEFSGM